MDLFVPWDALYKDNEEEVSENEMSLPDGSIIKAYHHNKADKYQQFITTDSNYKKMLHGKLLKEENEQIHVSWYYQFEMELILEKYGFKNIKHVERFLNGENHMTFIAENL